MKCKRVLNIGLILQFMILLLSIISNRSFATEINEDCAIIIVSSYDPDQGEHEKAHMYYEYLVDEGMDPARILFLSFDLSDTFVDGPSYVSVIEESFHALSNLSKYGDNVFVYISDHAPPPLSNSTEFVLCDGNLSFFDVDNWIDDIESASMTIYIGGSYSGYAGSFITSFDRTVICSMGADQDYDPDLFNLERSLNDSTADTDQNGHVDHIEAFLREAELLTITE